MPGIRSLEATEEGLRVVWDAEAPDSRFLWFWLRDHGHEPATLHPVTLQRQLDAAAIAKDIRGTSVSSRSWPLRVAKVACGRPSSGLTPRWTSWKPSASP